MRSKKTIYIAVFLLATISIGIAGLPGSVHADDVVVGLPTADGTDKFDVQDSGGISLMNVFSNGNVGIGTNSPTALLTLASNTTTNQGIDINNTSTGDPRLTFQLAGTERFSMGVDNSDADKFKIGTIAFTNALLTIDSAGNVGIGTASPTEKLEVNGQVKITDGSEGAGLVLTSDASGLASWQAAGGITETDPVYSAAPASGITLLQIGNWDTAFGWGDHDSAGYLTSYTETDPVFLAAVASSITIPDINKWNMAFSWGDHDSQGYITGYTETDPQVDGATMAGNSVPHWSGATLKGGSLYNNGSNVGIGTAIPNTLLEISGPANLTYGHLKITDTAGNDPFMSFYEGATKRAVLGYSNGYNAWNSWTGEPLAIMGGNVGIGITNPNALLSLGNVLSHTKVALYESGTANYGMGVVAGQFSFHLNAAGARYAFYDSATLDNEILTIQGTGSVGIGTTNPSTTMHIKSQTGSDATLSIDSFDANTTNSDAELHFREAGITKWKFQNDADQSDRLEIEGPYATNVMTIYQTAADTARVGIGTSDPGNFSLRVRETTGFGLNIENTSATDNWELHVNSSQLTLYANGLFRGSFNEVTGDYTPVSDRRLKKGLQPLANVLPLVLQLKPRTYKFIKGSPNQKRCFGFVAQEVEKVCPELTHKSDDKRSAGMYTLNYSGFGVLAIAAIQEQQKIIEKLQKEVKALKKRKNFALKQEIKDIKAVNKTVKNENEKLKESISALADRQKVIEDMLLAMTTGRNEKLAKLDGKVRIAK